MGSGDEADPYTLSSERSMRLVQRVVDTDDEEGSASRSLIVDSGESEEEREDQCHQGHPKLVRCALAMMVVFLLLFFLGVSQAEDLPIGRALPWVLFITGACCFVFAIVYVSLVVSVWEGYIFIEAGQRFLIEVGLMHNEEGYVHTEDLPHKRDRVKRTHPKIVAWVVIHQMLSWLFFGLAVAFGKWRG